MPSTVWLELENVGLTSELVPERARQLVEAFGRKIDIAIFLQEWATELFVHEVVQRLIGVLLPRRCGRHVRFRQSFRELIGRPGLAFARIGYESMATVTAAVIRASRGFRRSVIHVTPRSLSFYYPRNAQRQRLLLFIRTILTNAKRARTCVLKRKGLAPRARRAISAYDGLDRFRRGS